MFLLFLGFIFRCSFKDPEAPTWNANFIIPLINETYTMQELIEDEEDFFINPDKTIFFHVEQEFDKLGINDFMVIEDIDTSGHIPIVPQLEDTAWRKLDLNESMIVDTAILKSGFMDLLVTNQTEKEIELALVLPFLILDGEHTPYILHATMSPGQSIQKVDVDLSGALLHPKIENNKNRVEYGVYAVFEGLPISFEKNAYIEINIRDVVLQRFRGGLDELSVNLGTQQDTLDLPEELEGMKFGPINATLQVNSTFESIPGSVDFIIRGIREDSPPVECVAEQENIQTGGNPIILENVSDVINLYPDYIEFEGVVRMGGGYDENNPVIVNYDDYLLSIARIDVPLIFEFPEGWINQADVDTLDLNGEDDEPENDEAEDDDDGAQPNEIIRDNVNTAGIVVIAENHFPVGASVTLIFSKMRGDSTIYRTPYHPTDVVKVLDLQPGIIGGGAGSGNNPNVVTEDSVSTFDLILKEEEIELFESPEVYIGTQLELYPTTGMVKVLPSDYLTLRVRIEAELNTKIPEDEEEEEGGLQ